MHLQDGTKVFSASCDKTVQSWDFGGQQAVQVAAVCSLPSFSPVLSTSILFPFCLANQSLLPLAIEVQMSTFPTFRSLSILVYVYGI